ncbi:MAG TPA: glycoside hydrolase family 38 C-terminal domain-containing protein [Roseiflexaceae bacterium]
MRSLKRLCAVLALVLAGCAAPEPLPTPAPAPTAQPAPVEVPPAPLPPAAAINLDAETQALIAHARRAVFLVPFTHWDTDWHNTIDKYAAAADRSIADAIRLAKQEPRFRYAIEQVLFAQHFWDGHPEQRADLKALVQKRQITFAWGGITQPETSLTAPAVQVRNLQLGQEWIERTFGIRPPRTAWQSDAFGNSAAFPIFLARSGISYVYMGRGRGVCEQQFRCERGLTQAFYWASPADPAQRVLATYLFYSDAFGATAQYTDTVKQIPELRKIVDREFAHTNSQYLFLPFGADFSSPLPNLPALVDAWNAADHETVLVMADPETAFQYLATQRLPQYKTDLNPIWQAFYGTRPDAKIADKESEYYLTAADKFGLLLDAPRSSAWYTATVNAHYDNIAGVGFDSVWEASQRPRFEQAVAGAAADLSRTLARVAAAVPAPLVVFNSASWPRSGVVELHGDLPDLGDLPAPAQRLEPNTVALWASDVPPVGYRALTGGSNEITHPAAITQAGQSVSLQNGLVAVTLDGARGGTISSLIGANGPEMIAAPGDDVTYLDDNGDVYGSSFGAEHARESRVPARIAILAGGPLVARAQVSFVLGGQPITKTVTLYADSPRIDVALQIAALPQTTAIVQTPTTRDTQVRTDDLGFAALQHPVDDSPIISGTITYRREVFYPIISWADVSAGGAGLSLITHGLQAAGGTRTLNLMLVREVSDSGREGVTDAGYHLLRYAYVPHAGSATEARPWLAAYDFNQPLIPVWRLGEQMRVQLPFAPATPLRKAGDRPTQAFPTSLSLIAADSAIIADLYRRDDRVEAVILDYDPATPAAIEAGGRRIVTPPAALTTAGVDVRVP